jgi:hypothetical protein
VNYEGEVSVSEGPQVSQQKRFVSSIYIFYPPKVHMFSSTKQYASSPLSYYNDFVNKNEDLYKKMPNFSFPFNAYFLK